MTGTEFWCLFEGATKQEKTMMHSNLKNMADKDAKALRIKVKFPMHQRSARRRFRRIITEKLSFVPTTKRGEFVFSWESFSELERISEKFEAIWPQNADAQITCQYFRNREELSN